MPLRFLLDEQLRGPLWNAIERHNLGAVDLIDAVRVGDATDLPIGSDDRSILVWAEREQRIVVSADRSTMASHLAAHLATAHRSPGVLTLRPRVSLRDIVSYLVLVTYASEPEDWQDRNTFIP